MADFSGVANPKRVIAKREAAAENETAAHESAEAKSAMSQADFSKSKKRSPAEDAARQAKLISKLKSRDY